MPMCFTTRVETGHTYARVKLGETARRRHDEERSTGLRTLAAVVGNEALCTRRTCQQHQQRRQHGHGHAAAQRLHDCSDAAVGTVVCMLSGNSTASVSIRDRQPPS
jgi:hypothetical protein